MKTSLNIRFTRDKRKKDTVHYVYDIKHNKQRIVHYVYSDELTEQESVYYVHNIEHIEHNIFDTTFLYLYNSDRFFK